MSNDDDIDEKIRVWLRIEIAQAGHGIKKDLANHLGMTSQDGVTRIITEDPKRRLKKLPVGLLPKLEEFFGRGPFGSPALTETATEAGKGASIQMRPSDKDDQQVKAELGDLFAKLMNSRNANKRRQAIISLRAIVTPSSD